MTNVLKRATARRTKSVKVPAVRWGAGDQDIIREFLSDRIQDLADRVTGVMASDRKKDDAWVEGYLAFSDNMEKAINWMLLRLTEKRPGTGRIQRKSR